MHTHFNIDINLDGLKLFWLNTHLTKENKSFLIEILTIMQTFNMHQLRNSASELSHMNIMILIMTYLFVLVCICIK